MRSILFSTIASAALVAPSVAYADPTYSGASLSSFTFGSIYTENTTNLDPPIPAGWGSGVTGNLTVLTADTNLYNDPTTDSRYAFYRQAYSVVVGFNDQAATSGDFTFTRDVFGQRTTTLPTSGVDTFSGRTVWHDLDTNGEGTVSYTIDYDAAGGPTGSGTISNLKSGAGTIWAFTASGTLGSAPITYNTSQGNTYGVLDANGTGSITTNNWLVNTTWNILGLNPSYSLALFGPNGEEIAGSVDFGTTSIGSLGFAAKQ